MAKFLLASKGQIIGLPFWVFVSARPRQWLKNTALFAPLVFEGEFFNPNKFFITFFGFVIFCILTSGIYILNDVVDFNKDLAHPFKRKRPIAAGRINRKLALVIALAFIGFSILISTKISTLFSINLVETIGTANVYIFSIDKVMDFISISGGLLASLFILRIAKKYNPNNQGKILLFGLGWVIVNSLIFSLSPETSGSLVAIDSRNLYFSAVGMSLIVVLVLNII